MRRLIVAGLVLAALACGSVFVSPATQAQQQSGIIKIVVGDNGVTLVEGKSRREKGKHPPSVNSAKMPLNIVVFFDNPPGCVYIPSTAEWWC
jgi:hypothetical protein